MSTAVLALGFIAAAVIALCCAWAISRKLAWGPAGGLALIAATPLLPHVNLALGLSLDDVLPITGAAFLALWLPRGGRRSSVKAPGIVVVGLLLLAVAGFLSSLANASTGPVGVHMILRSAGRIVFMVCLGAVVTLSSPAATRRQLIAIAIAVTGTAEALFGTVAFLFPLPGAIGLEAARQNSVLAGQIAGRVDGTLGLSADFLGAIFLFSIPMTATLAAEWQGDRRVSLAWGAATALQVIALGLTFTRASIALGVAELLLLLILLRGRLRMLLPTAVLVAAMLILTPLGHRFLAEGNDRLALWTSAGTIAIDHPLLGVGPGRMLEVAFTDPGRYSVTAFGTAVSSAHNSVLLAAAETGALGALGALLLVVGLVAASLRAVIEGVRHMTSPLVMAAGVAMIAFVGQSMVNNLFTVAVTSTYAALVFATFLVATDEVSSRVEAVADVS